MLHSATIASVMTCPACGFGNEDGAHVCFRCGRDLFVLTAGALIGERYEIVHRLGKGGMGTVYKAHDRELDEMVAVKVLRGDADAAASADLARRFRSEIKLARKVRHRNVCAIHEFGLHGHVPYIVMELIEGVDLKQVLQQRGSLPAEEAVDLALQVTRGLQAIHDAGIVHRDLKTSNVMLDRAGVVRLMDFGIAKRFGEAGEATASGATLTGQVVGTPEYMSPEQARGDRVDTRSDVYALGVLLFEIVTGAVPFKGETPVATLLKHLQEPPPLDDSRLPLLLVPVLRRALAKDRERRFVSARELLDALREARQCMSPAGVSPRPPPVVGALAPRAETESLATPVPTSAPTAVPTVVPTRVRTRVGPVPRERPASPRWWPAAAVATAAAGGLALWLLGESNEGTGSATLPSAPPPPLSVASTLRASLPPVTSLPPERTMPPPSTARAALPPPPPSTRPVVATTLPVRVPPTTVPRPIPPTTIAAPPPPSVLATGTLRLRILPWAEVSLDGQPQGTTPLPPLIVSAGTHVVQLSHPKYRPLRKTVIVPAGGVARLEIDLSQEAFPR